MGLTALRNAAVLSAKSFLFVVFRLKPLKNRVLFMSFRGRNYGDNAKPVLEKLHELSPETELLWLKDPACDYALPNYVKPVDSRDPVARASAICTSRVVVNTHRFEREIRKRRGQFFIETWHGGLGIKKIEGDVPEVLSHPWEVGEIENTVRLCDLFLSNSRHLTEIYRCAFGYRGTVWRVGYPKNDILHGDPSTARETVRKAFGLGAETKLMLYAPTFRDSVWTGKSDTGIFDIGFPDVLKALESRFGGDWRILLRLHPVMQQQAKGLVLPDGVLDATRYPDMQQLIMGSDTLLSDYSSCLFDAAEAGLPCFCYVPDAERYAEQHGVYYTPAELPFPYAETPASLATVIASFDEKAYRASAEAFFRKAGLVQTDSASGKVAELIVKILPGDRELPEEIQNDD